MKKFQSLLAIVITVALVVTASCAPPPPPTPAPIPTPEAITPAVTTIVVTPTPQPTPVPEPVTIELFHMTWLPAAQAVVDEAVEKFEEANPGIEVRQTIVSWGEARAQFRTALAAGIAPDIVELPADWAADLFPQSAFLELDDLISEDLRDSFVEGAFTAAMYEGHLYGMPWETSPTGFFYRTDLFEEAGLDPNQPPKDWDELVEYAQKLTKVRADGTTQWGLGVPAGGWAPDSWFIQFMFQSGSPVVEQVEGKWVSDFDSPEALRALQFYYDLVHKYEVTPPGVTGMIWEDVKNAFAFDDHAMMISGMFVLNVLRDTAPELEGKWATAAHPAGPDGTQASLVIPNSMYITRQSKHPEEAWRFVEFFFSGTPSYAERYCEVGGIVGFQKHFAELPYAADPLRVPFIESVRFGHPHPLAPGYATFREVVLNPGLQALLRAERTPEQSATYFHEQLGRFLPQ